MDLLLKPRSDGTVSSVFREFGISQCYCKRLIQGRDRKLITKKRHLHAGVEIHLIEKGSVAYEIEGDTVYLNAGDFLILPPTVSHRIAGSGDDTCRYGITFLASGSCFRFNRRFVKGAAPAQVWESVRTLTEEWDRKGDYAEDLIRLRVTECILRLCNPFLSRTATSEEAEEDPRLALAIQYIRDNVYSAVTVSEVAEYCHLSTKHLTRLFQKKGNTVAEYIRNVRGEQIQLLLGDPSLTLSQISERMGFGDEYYFNAFFKKYAGISPGAYRKSVLKNQ